MQAGGQAAATSDSLGNVRAFLEGKGEEARRAGTLMDSMDANSDARLANLEMWNQAIITATSFVQLINSINLDRNVATSGGADFTGPGWRPGDLPPNDPFEPGPGNGDPDGDDPDGDDPTIVIVGEPDGVCEDIAVENALDPDCVDDFPSNTETIAAGDALDALIEQALNPDGTAGVTIATPGPIGRPGTIN